MSTFESSIVIAAEPGAVRFSFGGLGGMLTDRAYQSLEETNRAVSMPSRPMPQEGFEQESPLRPAAELVW